MKVRGYTEDTMVSHNAIAPDEPHDLGHIAFTYTDTKPWKPSKDHEFDTFEELAEYNAIDCIATGESMLALERELAEERAEEVYRLDMQMVHVALAMERAGMYVDPERWQARHDRATEELERATHTIRKVVGDWPHWDDRPAPEYGVIPPSPDEFNVKSPKQLAWALFDPQGPVGAVPSAYSEKTKQPATTQVALLKVLPKAPELVQAILAHRRFSKIKGTYLDGMTPFIRSDGRLHPKWNPTRGTDDFGGETKGARTGRWSSQPNCFDGETEVLTPGGWARFDQVDPTTVTTVAQYTADGRIEFVAPTAFIRKPYSGKLLRIRRGKRIDLCVTPDHRCLVRRRTGRLEVRTAEAFIGDCQQIHAGRGPDGPDDLSPDAVRFLCAVQADGSYTRGHQIIFKFSRRRKIERLTAILRSLGAEFRAEPAWNVDHYQTQFVVEGKWAGWAKERMPYKEFEWDLLQLSAAARSVFCEEVFLWDGSADRRNHYATSCARNAEIVQTLLTFEGISARVREYRNDCPNAGVSYQVDVLRRDYSWTTNFTKEEIDHEGHVYCLSVPSSYLVVRRSGTVMVTGQCQNWGKKPEFDEDGKPTGEVNMRAVIVAPPGRKLVGADLSQAELRIIAALSGDENLIRRCRDADEGRKLEPDHDPHSFVASLAFGDAYIQANKGKRKFLRDLVKRCAYGMAYLSTAQTVWTAIYDGGYQGPPIDLAMVERTMQAFFSAFPSVRPWQERAVREAQKTGYVWDALYGRRRVFPLRHVKPTVAVNFFIQSTVASMMNTSMWELFVELPSVDPTARIIAQVHDSIYVECAEDKAPKIAALLEAVMTQELCLVEGAPWMPFPATAEIGDAWDEVG